MMAVRKLMSMTESERYAMGVRGKTEVLSKYTYEKLAKAFIEVMQI